MEHPPAKFCVLANALRRFVRNVSADRPFMVYDKLAMEVAESQILAGKYRIERIIGRGGMGLVVAATHLQLGERVALKFLLPEALQNPEAVARFDREARAAVRIKSEHVARVSDVGTLENGAPYMVMEYLEGVDLSGWLVQRGALPVEQAVEFVLQACEAIAEAHTLGIVHRDLKPANLFVVERPDGALAVKVLDFGISKTTGLSSSGAGMTKTSTAMGSPLYMSPEQMQSAKDVDRRGDIWALGVVLYELVSGCTPFPGDTMAELVLKVLTAAPVPLRGVCPQAPPGLEAVVLKCLQKEREARYQSVSELAVALYEFGPRRSKASVERIQRLMQRAGMSASPTQLPASSDPTVTRTVLAPQTMASWSQTNPPANHRRRVVLVTAALMAVPIFAVGAIALVRSGGHGRTLASSAVPLGSIAQRSAEPPQIGKSALSVEPAASTLVVEPSGGSARPLPTVSAASPAHTAALAATSNRSPSPPHTVAPHAPKPAAPQPPAPEVSKVPPNAPKNPLKMPMQ
jgi:serine/threonine protein kinase